MTAWPENLPFAGLVMTRPEDKPNEIVSFFFLAPTDPQDIIDSMGGFFDAQGIDPGTIEFTMIPATRDTAHEIYRRLSEHQNSMAHVVD